MTIAISPKNRLERGYVESDEISRSHATTSRAWGYPKPFRENTLAMHMWVQRLSAAGEIHTPAL